MRRITDIQPVLGTRIKSLEILALMEGIKKVVRHGYFEQEMPAVEGFCRENGLFLEKSLIKVKILDSKKRYSNKGMAAPPGMPGMYFVYISKDEYKAVKAHYHEMKQDHISLGGLLGYPPCCTRFFSDNFDSSSDLDTHFILKSIEASGKGVFPFCNNVLHKENDLVLISHFPCRLDCKASADIGKRNLELLGDDGKENVKSLKGTFSFLGHDVTFA
jgi:hypothetical protein